jgi:hypothetical protein
METKRSLNRVYRQIGAYGFTTRAVRDHLTNFAEYDDGFSVDSPQAHPSSPS